MCRILLLSFTIGVLIANTGCRSCCRSSPSFCPSYGPYNPYAGNCVNEDIWTTPGHTGSHCHCGRSHCGCSAPSYPATTYPTTTSCDCHAPVSNCGCAAPVTSDCGCAAPVSSDCGCGGASSFGEPQIYWGEPVYNGPTSMPAPPHAPPSTDEYYVPARPDDFESDEPSEARSRNSTLPATLVVPARL